MGAGAGATLVGVHRLAASVPVFQVPVSPWPSLEAEIDITMRRIVASLEVP
jgi:acetyl esterase/lipase